MIYYDYKLSVVFGRIAVQVKPVTRASCESSHVLKFEQKTIGILHFMHARGIHRS